MKFRDLGAQYAHLKREIGQNIQQVLDSGQFIEGRMVAQLEEELAAYVGVRHCITCANGTDALQLALMAWGVGEGDAVFTSDFTFFASGGCISILGATPVLVDIDPRTFNICPDALEAAILQVQKEGKLRAKAILPVDLFGLPADYTKIRPIAQKYSLAILEDGAQGFGGAIAGKRACSFGDISTTSFFPAKPLGCYGDGGALFTDDDETACLLRSLKAQGRSPEDKYDNQLIGMNSRLDALQAAILLPKLNAFINYELDAVNQVAAWYTENLTGLVTTPFIPNEYTSSWAQYSILLKTPADRQALQQHLKALGIPSMIYYPRGLHQQTAYAGLGLQDSQYPNTLSATQHILSLPMHPYLEKSEVIRTANAIRQFEKTQG